jgi:hypothetical protein
MCAGMELAIVLVTFKLIYLSLNELTKTRNAPFSAGGWKSQIICLVTVFNTGLMFTEVSISVHFLSLHI